MPKRGFMFIYHFIFPKEYQFEKVRSLLEELTTLKLIRSGFTFKTHNGNLFVTHDQAVGCPICYEPVGLRTGVSPAGRTASGF